MNEETVTSLDGELTRVPDPDFARLPDNYGEDDPTPVRHKAATPRIAAQLDMLQRYHEMTEGANGKSGVIGRRPAEPEQIEAMEKELTRMGVRWVDGVPHLG